MRILAALLIASLAVAASARQQTRDALVRAPEPAGTSSLAGVVVVPDSPAGTPVRRATVQLTGSGLSRPRLAVTDDAGRFAFSGLPAGSFSLSATKAGYVPSFHGSRQPGRGPAVPIAVPEGRTVTVTMPMLRGAVIAGTIVDQFGRPAPEVIVEAIAYRLSRAGTRTPSPTPRPVRADTDERGEFRIFGLTPGTYAIVAAVRVPGGEVTPIDAAEISWAEQQAAAMRSGRRGALQSAPPQRRAVGLAPVYFPGTTAAGSASLIDVAAGEERTGIGFALQYAPVATIAGTIVGPDGQPATGATLSLLSPIENEARAFTLFNAFRGRPSTLIRDGRFTISGVGAGDRVLWAEGGLVPFERPPSPSSDAIGPSGAPTLWGRLPIAVSGQDATDLVVRLMPGSRVTGSVAFKRTSLALPTDLTRVRVVLQSAGDLIPLNQGGRAASAAADGSFVMQSVPPGRYRVQPSVVGGAAAGFTGWVLHSVMSGDRDVADVPLDIASGGDLRGLVVTYTDRPSQVSGTLLDAAGRGTAAFAVVAFSADPAHWTAGSRRTLSARPTADGRYVISGLPAGSYHVAVVTEFDQSDLNDPEFLEQLRAASIPIALADGERKTQDIRIGGGPTP
jgi:hypothetical protein